MKQRIGPRTPFPPQQDMTGWSRQAIRLRMRQHAAAKAARIAEAREASLMRGRKGKAVRLYPATCQSSVAQTSIHLNLPDCQFLDQVSERAGASALNVVR